MKKTEKKGPVFVTGKRGISRVRIFKHRKSERYFMEWYVRVPGQHRPKPVTRSLGDVRLADAKQEATKKSDELYAQYLQGTSAGGVRTPTPLGAKAFREYMVSRPLTIDWLMQLFIEARKKEGIERGLYGRVRTRLIAGMDGKHLPVEQLDSQIIAEYIQRRRAGGLHVARSLEAGESAGTRTLGPVRNRAIDEDLTVLRSALNWAREVKVAPGLRLLSELPVRKWPDLEEKNVKRPILSHEEAKLLIERAWELRPELWLAIVLCFHTGMRLQSVRQLSWQDINLSEGTITWPGMIMKNETELTTPITPELLAALKYYMEQNTVKAEGPIFRQPGTDRPRKRDAFYKWWRACLEVVGMPTDKRLGFHSFRRRLASDLAGAPLPVLMALGGWRNPDVVVKAYASPSMEALKAVLANRAAFANGRLTSNRDRLLPGPVDGES